MLLPSARRSAALALINAAACWGLGTVVAKRAIAEIPPFALLTIQLGSSLLFLAVLMRVRGLPFQDRAASPLLGRLGLLNPGIAYALSLVGLVSISASLSVLLWALEPLLILLLAVAFLRERVGRAVVALSGTAIGGLALIAAQPGQAALAGVALTVLGVVCCAVYTIVTRRSSLPRTRPFRSSWRNRPTRSGWQRWPLECSWRPVVCPGRTA